MGMFSLMNNRLPPPSAALRCGSFLVKNIGKKHLCGHDKNYYYFCKSNIPAINLIRVSRNMKKKKKNMSL